MQGQGALAIAGRMPAPPTCEGVCHVYGVRVRCHSDTPSPSALSFRRPAQRRQEESALSTVTGQRKQLCGSGVRDEIYLLLSTTSPFSTLMPPTLSGNFNRSRCSASRFCNGVFTMDTGTLRSPILNCVGSNVA